MRFTVAWKPWAKERLAEIWIEATDRRSVSSAANEIDRLLRNDPQSRGESRDEFSRILIVLPLAVVYEIHERDRMVSVLSVRHVPAGR